MTIPFLGKFRQRDCSEQRPKTPATTSIEIAQRAMADPSGAGLAPLAAALQDIVEHEAWRRDTAVPSGALFPSFGEFAIAEVPYGLGLTSTPAARLLRHALFEVGLLGPWTEVLELIARKPGRPEKPANREGFVRFYTVLTSTTSRDRLLLKLKPDHPEIFRKVCEGACTVREAGIEAGLVVAAKRDTLRFGVCDLEGAKRLSDKALAKLVGEVFGAATLNAQCTFIKGLEVHLGPDLARHWRARHSPQPDDAAA